MRSFAARLVALSLGWDIWREAVRTAELVTSKATRAVELSMQCRLQNRFCSWQLLCVSALARRWQLASARLRVEELALIFAVRSWRSRTLRISYRPVAIALARSHARHERLLAFRRLARAARRVRRYGQARRLATIGDMLCAAARLRCGWAAFSTTLWGRRLPAGTEIQLVDTSSSASSASE